MSNALTILNKGNANLPAHLRQALENDNSWDSVGGMSVPRIEVNDRRIKAFLNGTEVASSKDPITVVLVKPGAVGRTFYLKEYQKGEKARPDCYSADGIKPAADAQNPQSKTCDTCEQNIKGSSKTMANAKACRYRQPMAVWIPGDKTWDTLFRVSLPATAIFPDEENSDGFRPLNKYVKELRAAGANPNMVWTQMAIDDYQDQPRLLFKVGGWIDDEESFEQVRQLMDSPDMDSVLNMMQAEEPAETETGSALGARPSHIDANGVDERRTRRSDAEPKDYPTAWPKGVEATDFIDEVVTYWFHEDSDTYFMVPAGESLPAENVCEEMQEVAFAADVAQQQREIAEAKAAKEEEARRVLEAKRLEEERAAAEAAMQTRSTRSRRGAAAEEPAAGGTRSRRGAAAEEVQEATSTRTRTPKPEPKEEVQEATSTRTRTPKEEAPAAGGLVSRRRQPAATAATGTDEAVAPRTNRRAPAAGDDGATEDEGVKPPVRRAAQSSEAPATRENNANLAALEDIILSENADD